jgi:hypothetical protein
LQNSPLDRDFDVQSTSKFSDLQLNSLRPEQGFFDRVSGKMFGGAGSFHAELPTFRAIRWPLPSSKLGSSGPFAAPRWFGQFINRDYYNSTLIAVVRQRHPPLGHSAGCR